MYSILVKNCSQTNWKPYLANNVNLVNKLKNFLKSEAVTFAEKVVIFPKRCTAEKWLLLTNN